MPKKVDLGRKNLAHGQKMAAQVRPLTISMHCAPTPTPHPKLRPKQKPCGPIVTGPLYSPM
jgi:hypothetical protein